MLEKRTYNTKQRDKIIFCIKSFGDSHFTAAELFERLAADGIPVGQATVYRMLELLSERGEIRKYTLDGKGASCYQNEMQGGDCALHFHLKCLDCGRLLHTDCSELSKISSHLLSEHGFSIDSSKTVFYGTCPVCSGKGARQ